MKTLRGGVDFRPVIRSCAVTLVLVSCALITSLRATADATEVRLVRTPQGGIQPQATIDDRGAIHLVYYKGDPAKGDLFYGRMEAGSKSWSMPIQVNSQNGSAIAVGSIRGAHLAVGKSRRVHVVWNGSSETPDMKHPGAPMLYTRLNDAGTAFEAQRDLITKAAGLDGGGSVAADQRGNVYVTWHATIPDRGEGEENRAVFVARSIDEGRTFAPEKQALSKNTGACGCCGMRSFVDPGGNLYLLYRAASEQVNRDQILLFSRDGSDFQIVHSDPWKIPACPMSSAAFATSQQGTLAAWETEGRVYFATVNPRTMKVSKTIAPEPRPKQKHPVLASNKKGETLLTWTEGTGWQKGGALAWQIFDAQNQPTSKKGRQEGVPVWSFAAVVAQTDGSFLVIY